MSCLSRVLLQDFNHFVLKQPSYGKSSHAKMLLFWAALKNTVLAYIVLPIYVHSFMLSLLTFRIYNSIYQYQSYFNSLFLGQYIYFIIFKMLYAHANRKAIFVA